MSSSNFLTGIGLVAVSTLLIGCGSPSDTGDQPLLGAAQGVGPAAPAVAELPSTFLELSNEELTDLAEVPETKTSDLQVASDFTFSTSRRVGVSLDIPEASDMQAEASICTDYTLMPDGSYDINYDSCVMTAPLQGGLLNDKVNLVNQHQSALAVVWLEDTTMQPVFREIEFN